MPAENMTEISVGIVMGSWLGRGNTTAGHDPDYQHGHPNTEAHDNTNKHTYKC